MPEASFSALARPTIIRNLLHTAFAKKRLAQAGWLDCDSEQQIRVIQS